MATRYTKEELGGKVDWEGGIAEAITGYGITVDALPEDAPTWVVANWKVVQESGAAIQRIAEWLYGGDE